MDRILSEIICLDVCLPHQTLWSLQGGGALSKCWPRCVCAVSNTVRALRKSVKPPNRNVVLPVGATDVETLT